MNSLLSWDMMQENNKISFFLSSIDCIGLKNHMHPDWRLLVQNSLIELLKLKAILRQKILAVTDSFEKVMD